jgi:hypothetical protein
MSVRPLDLFDLPFIYKYRRQVVPLDSARAFTQPDLLGVNAFFTNLNSAREIATAISKQNGSALLGQVTHLTSSPHASLGFLAPPHRDELEPAPLLDYLAQRAGGWGCQYMLAEVDECSPVFKSLRQVGFSMYAWQRVWKLSGTGQPDGQDHMQETRDADLVSVQSLYNQIVPALLQAVEPLPRRTGGLICRQDGELRAYLSLTTGPTGIWVQPLIHPDANCAAGLMNALLAAIPERRSRPVYLCVRSYQAWLESMLEELGASAGERQAVMIRHLAVHQRAEETLPVKNTEPAWAKSATTVSHINPSDGE